MYILNYPYFCLDNYLQLLVTRIEFSWFGYDWFTSKQLQLIFLEVQSTSKKYKVG